MKIYCYKNLAVVKYKTMKNILDDIKRNSFKPLYLLYGEEGYLVSQFKKKLTDAIVGDNTMNLLLVREKPDLNRIIETAKTMPFFSDRRLIVLDGCDMLKTKNEAFIKLLDNIPDYLTIIFVESKADKRYSIYSKIQKYGYVCELKIQSQENVISFIRGRCAEEKKEISEDAALELYSRARGDLGLINGELEKLFSFTLGREGISTEDVIAISSVRVEARVFDMIDAISYKNTRKALTLYYDLLEVKESSYKILSLMQKHFSGLLQVSCSPKMPPGELAKSIGINGVAPFVAGRYLKQVKTFTKEKLKDLVIKCADTEEAVKTGRISDRIGVELIIAEALS